MADIDVILLEIAKQAIELGIIDAPDVETALAQLTEDTFSDLEFAQRSRRASP